MLIQLLCSAEHHMIPALRPGDQVQVMFIPVPVLLVQATPLILAHLMHALSDGALTPIDPQPMTEEILLTLRACVQEMANGAPLAELLQAG